MNAVVEIVDPDPGVGGMNRLPGGGHRLPQRPELLAVAQYRTAGHPAALPDPVQHGGQFAHVARDRLVQKHRLAGGHEWSRLLQMAVPVGGVNNHAVDQIKHRLGMLHRMRHGEFLTKFPGKSRRPGFARIPCRRHFDIDLALPGERPHRGNPAFGVRGAQTDQTDSESHFTILLSLPPVNPPFPELRPASGRDESTASRRRFRLLRSSPGR
ncbi:hypothetical protein SDC9_135983 [bioreactor metagenome]|uniref:Uncharacterized protein n=1 Tax=bioreactor metagenome TaxID=1076179 RepID=A0A645DHV6_9ZZZZ